MGGSWDPFSFRTIGYAIFALHLLHSLSFCLACIHDAREYHGDLHSDNILVRRAGIKLELRLLDFFHRGSGWRTAVREDIVDAVRIFYDALGGRRRYAKQRTEVKQICRG